MYETLFNVLILIILILLMLLLFVSIQTKATSKTTGIYHQSLSERLPRAGDKIYMYFKPGQGWEVYILDVVTNVAHPYIRYRGNDGNTYTIDVPHMKWSESRGVWEVQRK